MLTQKTAVELARILASREASVREVVDAHFDRIDRCDGDYGCYLELSKDRAYEMADAAQARLDKGEGGPLTGVPIALKDNISTKGVRTTCASRILENYVPPFDATTVERLEQAGMVLLGKTNLDEFAMGASTEHSAFQLTRNPWDTERSPGGSSGGSAAAVAAELAPVALGSDTGGSIRQPAALCGIVGFKPTYGRCSRYGLVAFGSSLDQIGPLARTVEDAALLAEAVTGHDPMDGTSLPEAPISTANLKKGSLKGLKVGLPDELFGEGMDPRVLAAVNQSVALLHKEGVEFRRISLPAIKYGVTTYYIIAPAEASSNLARFDGVRYGPRAEGEGHIGVVEATRAQFFGHEVKARIMIGTYALSAGYYDAYYLRAQQVRAVMKQEFDLAFQDVDLVLSPTSPVPAFKLGELKADPMALKVLDYCTIPANMGGYPGISLNCGLADGLPVGLQLVGPTMADEAVFQAAFAIESALGATVRPPVP
ncbi:MAG: Asp-tRNA(Asn)/Glu-tRNA(Gln) amidotransferase subunit GatA [Fimbriimonadales bacterium]